MSQLTLSATLLVLFLLCCSTQNSGVLCQDDDPVPPGVITAWLKPGEDPLADAADAKKDGKQPEVLDAQNLPPFPILRNTLLDSDNEVESFNGYHYDKPEIPFEDTNVSPVEVQGYNYPKPANPLTLPERPDRTNKAQQEVSQNVAPESDQGPPVIDLPEDTIRILDDEVSVVEDEPQDASSNGN
uniref:Putative secreted protein n=1 Tax=Phlebotomus kandelakii TaxID=1109342 RepID=A0A6B2ECS2_9DIPT